jgi:DNA-binding transcriptional ArsR family regulator
VKPITNVDDPRYVKALSHPLRVRILSVLEERTASPVQLAEWLQASLGVVSYHVRTLHRLGLIDLVGETPRRGAVEHHYRAKARPSMAADSWDKAPPVAKQALVGATLQQIHDYARVSAAAGGFDRADARLSRTHVTVDAKGWEQLTRAFDRLLEQVEKIESQSADRLKKGAANAEPLRVGVVGMLFEAQRLSDDSRDDGAAARPRRRRKPASAGKA